MSLREINGRAFSWQTRQDIERLLATEMASLTAEQRQVLEEMLADHAARQIVAPGGPGGADPGLADHYAGVLWKREPVDMATFVFDEYYLGETCSSIFPRLLEDITEVFSGAYRECIWTGALGTGKTFVCSLGICRGLYELSCMADPQSALGLAPGTPIVMACISVSEDLAKEVALKNIVSKIAGSAYFKSNFPFKVTQKMIRFPNNVQVLARATTPQSLLGTNVYMCLLDEANFMPRRRDRAAMRHGIVDMAKVIYDNLNRRMFTRYGNQGKLFIPSSKATFDSFISDRIAAARTDPTIFVRDYALWDVREGFSDKTFWVLCGNEQVQNRILKSAEVEPLREELPDRTVLLEVPEDLRSKFESDLEGSIRDLGGIATVAISPFIQRVSKIRALCDPARVHPYSVEVLDPSVGGQFAMSRMVEQVRVASWGGRSELSWQPRLNPSAPRHIHMDMAVSGCAAGFCMAHVAGHSVQRRLTEQHRSYTIHAEVFAIDFILRIIPPAGSDLDFELFETLVYALQDMGYPVTWVTADQWQSIYVLQRLQKRGLQTDKISMDRTWEPYQVLKEAIYEDRVRVYDYAPLKSELQGLEADWDKHRVLPPRNGSKDVADACAGAVFSLVKHRDQDTALPILRGVSGSGDDLAQFEALAMGLCLDESRQQQEESTDALSLPPFMLGSYSGLGEDSW